ncbi:hypothetical protein D3C76_1057060 [compost metagenome]
MIVRLPWALPPLLRSISPALVTVTGCPLVNGLITPVCDTRLLLASMFTTPLALAASPRARVSLRVKALPLLRLNVSQLV